MFRGCTCSAPTPVARLTRMELNEERYLRYNDSTYMVSVAKWLRRQVVALEIEGSNPSVHPTIKIHPGEGALFPCLLRL
jgi:hypothetical protein